MVIILVSVELSRHTVVVLGEIHAIFVWVVDFVRSPLRRPRERVPLALEIDAGEGIVATWAK